jgi:hypothetical protein
MVTAEIRQNAYSGELSLLPFKGCDRRILKRCRRIRPFEKTQPWLNTKADFTRFAAKRPEYFENPIRDRASDLKIRSASRMSDGEVDRIALHSTAI